jgi:Family of unknown function (DUF6527)
MRFRSLFRQFLVWMRRIRQPDLVARRVAIHPSAEQLKPGMMLVVGDQTLQKWGCFQCPGGCGEIIKLSLNAKQHPCWAITIDGLERPTVSPSVRQLNDCRCHFWIRQGTVEWCADSSKPNFL